MQQIPMGQKYIRPKLNVTNYFVDQDRKGEMDKTDKV